MATPTSDKRKNYHTVRYGTAEGEIKFGHLHRDNELSGVMLRNGSASSGGNHYISLDSTGTKNRTNGTICSSPGSFQVKAGYDLENQGSKENKNIGIYMDAKNGDIVIRAPSGRIRMEAIDIDILATLGPNNEKGTVSINGNEKVIIKAQTIDVSSKVNTKIFSEKTVECVGNGLLNIYGGFVDCADGATKVNGSKIFSQNEINHSIGFGL